MQNFEFYSAESIEDCLDYLSENKESCKVIAGGTDLIPVLRKEEVYPKYVLNILEIESFRGITEEDDEIRIGPTTTFTEIVESEVLNRTLPLLVQAILYRLCRIEFEILHILTLSPSVASFFFPNQSMEILQISGKFGDAQIECIANGI